MGNISERLLIVIKEKAGGNRRRFSKKTGLPYSTITNYAGGRPPNADALKAICEIYEVNINWLLTGNGEKYLDTESHDNPNGSNVLKIHRGIIEQFKDQERAKNINQALLELETLSDTALRDVEIYLSGMATVLRSSGASSQQKSRTGRRPPNSKNGTYDSDT